MLQKKDKNGCRYTVKSSHTKGNNKIYNVVRVADGKTISISEEQYKTSNFSFDEINKLTKSKSIPTKSNLMGLDLSSTNSGVAIFVDKKYVYSTVIKPIGTTHKRLNYIVDELEKIIEKYNIQQVVIEDIYLQKDKQYVFKLLSGLQHCVCCMLSRKNISFELITAKQWREHSGVSNKGRDASKNSSIKKTIEKYGVHREDESEAINICQGYINMAGGK